MKSPLAEQAAHRIRALIQLPSHSQGGRLPPEEALAAELGISRPVLRQALAQLKSEGLLESRRGSGTYIKQEATAVLPGYGLPETLSDLEDCLRFRMVIEEMAAAEAALRHTPAALRELTQSIVAMEAAMATEAQSFEADMAFHLAIARSTGNRYMYMTLNFLLPHIRICLQMGRQLRAVPLTQSSRRVASEHRAILQAIQERNADEARQRMHDHLASGIERIFGRKGW